MSERGLFTQQPQQQKQQQRQPQQQQQLPQHLQRRTLLSLAVPGAAAALSLEPSAHAAGVACPGQRGYALQQCLRQARKASEAAAGGSASDTQAQRQYEQPGELVTLPSGIQYRELDPGSGRQAQLGSSCEISYTVYRLSSGGYYKYSSGGTPVYMFSLGYGNEGRDDVGATYRFTLGDASALPRAVTAALLGMQERGRRRVLVPPQLGWALDPRPGPPPPTFGGGRRLEAHRDEALLFEAELVKVRDSLGGASSAGASGVQVADPTEGLPSGATPYRLPAPPSPFKNKLG